MIEEPAEPEPMSGARASPAASLPSQAPPITEQRTPPSDQSETRASQREEAPAANQRAARTGIGSDPDVSDASFRPGHDDVTDSSVGHEVAAPEHRGQGQTGEAEQAAGDDVIVIPEEAEPEEPTKEATKKKKKKKELRKEAMRENEEKKGGGYGGMKKGYTADVNEESDEFSSHETEEDEAEKKTPEQEEQEKKKTAEEAERKKKQNMEDQVQKMLTKIKDKHALRLMFPKVCLKDIARDNQEVATQSRELMERSKALRLTIKKDPQRPRRHSVVSDTGAPPKKKRKRSSSPAGSRGKHRSKLDELRRSLSGSRYGATGWRSRAESRAGSGASSKPTDGSKSSSSKREKTPQSKELSDLTSDLEMDVDLSEGRPRRRTKPSLLKMESDAYAFNVVSRSNRPSADVTIATGSRAEGATSATGRARTTSGTKFLSDEDVETEVPVRNRSKQKAVSRWGKMTSPGTSGGSGARVRPEVKTSPTGSQPNRAGSRSEEELASIRESARAHSVYEMTLEDMQDPPPGECNPHFRFVNFQLMNFRLLTRDFLL